MSAPGANRTCRDGGNDVAHSGSSGRIRRTKRYGISRGGFLHCGLMPADLITLAHLSVWSAMNFPNSADVNEIGWTPNPTRRAFILGSATTASISFLSFSIISLDVSFGAPTPYQLPAS